jgi:hypothetical protein
MPGAAVKISQYCSVCKQKLEMEVVPTSDGEDDGVIWLRCPSCQGFLPKISSSLDRLSGRAPSDSTATGADEDAPVAVAEEQRADELADAGGDEDAAPAGRDAGREPEPGPREPLSEYAATLAAADLDSARPYRPWETYEIGDVIHHLAWDDCGVVVAKESLPGGRSIAKVYFDATGVVRLIENAGRPS